MLPIKFDLLCYTLYFLVIIIFLYDMYMKKDVLPHYICSLRFILDLTGTIFVLLDIIWVNAWSLKYHSISIYGKLPRAFDFCDIGRKISNYINIRKYF